MRHFLPIALLALATPLIAQGLPKTAPGAPDPSRVTAGAYKVDTGHTQLLWQVDHMGFSKFDGQFGGITGTMQLDPANPSAAKLSVTIPGSGLTTTVAELNTHLNGTDFFDFAKFPNATFVSTKVEATGTTARITGDLTLHGVTRPITLDARFVGAGQGMMPPKALNIGFEATARLKRSDFGLGYGVPIVSDEVELRINAAFEKTG